MRYQGTSRPSVFSGSIFLRVVNFENEFLSQPYYKKQYFKGKHNAAD